MKPLARLAVFGDVHGQLEGVEEAVRRCEERLGAAVVGSLQCGDLESVRPLAAAIGLS